MEGPFGEGEAGVGYMVIYQQQSYSVLALLSVLVPFFLDVLFPEVLQG